MPTAVYINGEKQRVVWGEECLQFRNLRIYIDDNNNKSLMAARDTNLWSIDWNRRWWDAAQNIWDDDDSGKVKNINFNDINVSGMWKPGIESLITFTFGSILGLGMGSVPALALSRLVEKTDWKEIASVFQLLMIFGPALIGGIVGVFAGRAVDASRFPQKIDLSK